MTGAVAEAESAGAKAAQLRERHVGHVDIENERGFERVRKELRHEESRHFGAGVEVSAAFGAGAERHRDRGQAEEATLDGGRDGARVRSEERRVGKECCAL